MKPKTVKRADFKYNGIQTSRDPETTAHKEILKFYGDILGDRGLRRAPSILEQLAAAKSNFQVDTILADAAIFAPGASQRARKAWERAANVKRAELKGWVLA